jgi:cyanoexosortase A
MLNIKNARAYTRRLLRRHGSNRRSLWLLLAALLFTWATSVLMVAQLSPSIQLLNLMVWFGCATSLEDQLARLYPSPSRSSLAAGTALITYSLARGFAITSEHDRFIYMMIPAIITGLAMLNKPLAMLRMFRVPIVISLLFPISLRILTLEDAFVDITSTISWAILAAIGFDPVLEGNRISMPTGSVTIGGYCTGVDQIAICLVVAVIFLLVFPLQKWMNRLAAIAISIVSGFGVNAVRISLLAYLVAIPEKKGMSMFRFMHDSYGSLVFSLIAVGIFGWAYTLLVDQEINERQLERT